MSLILGVRFSDKNTNECIEELEQIVNSNKFGYHVITANPEVLTNLLDDENLKVVLEDADLIVPDGIGIVLASKLLNQNITERVAGIDLIENFFICRETNNKYLKVFLLGSTIDNVELASQKLSEKYSFLDIVGTHHGFFNVESDLEVSNIIDTINKAEPDLLLVGLGTPKQEKFIHYIKSKIRAKVIIGCGGSIDVFSGQKKRAPLFFQKMNIEWAYRLFLEPFRIKRQLKIPLFLLRVLNERFSRR